VFDPSKIQAVLWDLDDTLYSRVQAAHRTYPSMFRDLLYRNRDEAFLQAAADYMITQVDRRTMIGEAAFSALIQRIPPDKPFDLTACQEYYFDHMHKFAAVGTEQMAVIQKLRSIGIKTAILTNVGMDRVAFQRNKIHALGLEPLFDAIILSGEFGIHKPDRRVFDYAAAQLGVDSEACVFVGDNPDADIAGARSAGMEAVWIDVWGDGDRFTDDPKVHRVQSVLEYFQF